MSRLGRVISKSLAGTGRRYEPLADEGKGGADFSLVRIDAAGRPECWHHGAMNKVSEHGYWRCITTSGTNRNHCRAACQESA